MSPATAVSKRVSCTSRGKSDHNASTALSNKRSNSWVELFIIISPRCSKRLHTPLFVAAFEATLLRRVLYLSACRPLSYPWRGPSQTSVTVLSMTCCWTLLQRGQANVRKSRPGELLGSIADNFIGEPQAVHCGPWFCVSSMHFLRLASASHSLWRTLTSALAVVRQAMRSFWATSSGRLVVRTQSDGPVCTQGIRTSGCRSQ